MTNDDKNKGFVSKFVDWVNADDALPTLEELQHSHEEQHHSEEQRHEDAHRKEEKHKGEEHHPHQQESHEEESGQSARDGKRKKAGSRQHEELGSPLSETDASAFREDALDDIAADDGPVLDVELEYPDPIVTQKPDFEPEVSTTTAKSVRTKPTQADVMERELRAERKKRMRRFSAFYGVLGGIIAVVIIAVLLVTVFALPEYGNANNPAINEVYERYIEQGTNETGATNIVAAMILDYRAFDTLGESLMLYTAIMGVVLLLRTLPFDKTKKEGMRNES